MPFELKIGQIIQSDGLDSDGPQDLQLIINLQLLYTTSAVVFYILESTYAYQSRYAYRVWW